MTSLRCVRCPQSLAHILFEIFHSRMRGTSAILSRQESTVMPSLRVWRPNDHTAHWWHAFGDLFLLRGFWSISICYGARCKSLPKVMVKSRVGRGHEEPLWVARPCGFLCADFCVRILGADFLVRFWCEDFSCGFLCVLFLVRILTRIFWVFLAATLQGEQKSILKKSSPKSSPNPSQDICQANLT